MKLYLLIFPLLFVAALASVTVQLDAHSHYRTGWDAPITVKESIAWHKDHGYTAAAFTEHSPWMTDPRPVDEIFLPYDTMNIDPTLPVLPGIEWTARSLHVVVLFEPATYNDFRISKLTDDPTFKRVFWSFPICSNITEYCELAQKTHEIGGLLGVAHYSITVAENALNKDGCPVEKLDALYDQCHFDFVEVGNTVMDPVAFEFAKKRHLPMTAGSDVHDFQEKWDRQAPVAYTFVDLPDGTTEITPQDIFLAIKANSTRVPFGAKEVGKSARNVLVIIIASVAAAFTALAVTLGCKKKK